MVTTGPCRSAEQLSGGSTGRTTMVTLRVCGCWGAGGVTTISTR